MKNCFSISLTGIIRSDFTLDKTISIQNTNEVTRSSDKNPDKYAPAINFGIVANLNSLEGLWQV